MDYFAGTKRDFDLDTAKYFTKTTEEPTKPGLYWAHTDVGWFGLHLEYLEGMGLHFDSYFLSKLITSLVITEWIGPLPEPE